MSKKQKFLLFALLTIDVIFLVISIFLIFRPEFHFGNFAVLNPKGVIAQQERRLIITATLLMLVVVIPVFITTIVFAFKYRAGKKGAEYSPDSENSLATGLILWAIPAAIIFVLAVINWQSTHALDPSKPLASNIKPITIQVVALQWKWLFIYPEQNIATVNFVEFPQKTPVNFQLTADAPMNSFWIPQLGGQMYAMAGMSTQLHLMANEVGEYNGSAAEISGAGFAGMRFIAKSTSQADFDAWVKSVKKSSRPLNLSAYDNLSKPSENNPKTFYSSVEKNLYNSIIMKFMTPMPQMQEHQMVSGMDMK